MLSSFSDVAENNAELQADRCLTSDLKRFLINIATIILKVWPVILLIQRKKPVIGQAWHKVLGMGKRREKLICF